MQTGYLRSTTSLAERTHPAASNCTVALALAQIGDRWTILILRELFYGASRFEQIHSTLHRPGNILAERLKRLVDEEIIERSPYKEPRQRTRRAYSLTDRGRQLLPVLVALMQRGDHYLADDVPPVAGGRCEPSSTASTGTATSRSTRSRSVKARAPCEARTET